MNSELEKTVLTLERVSLEQQAGPNRAGLDAQRARNERTVEAYNGMLRGHAENRNMVFPKQGGAVACYRHEKFKPLPDSAIDDFPSPALALGPCTEAVRRMAATRTRDTFGTCRSKIAIDPCAAAIRGRRQLGEHP
jgi:hypothetical protein